MKTVLQILLLSVVLLSAQAQAACPAASDCPAGTKCWCVDFPSGSGYTGLTSATAFTVKELSDPANIPEVTGTFTRPAGTNFFIFTWTPPGSGLCSACSGTAGTGCSCAGFPTTFYGIQVPYVGFFISPLDGGQPIVLVETPTDVNKCPGGAELINGVWMRSHMKSSSTATHDSLKTFGTLTWDDSLALNANPGRLRLKTFFNLSQLAASTGGAAFNMPLDAAGCVTTTGTILTTGTGELNGKLYFGPKNPEVANMRAMVYRAAGTTASGSGTTLYSIPVNGAIDTSTLAGRYTGFYYVRTGGTEVKPFLGTVSTAGTSLTGKRLTDPNDETTTDTAWARTFTITGANTLGNGILTGTLSDGTRTVNMACSVTTALGRNSFLCVNQNPSLNASAEPGGAFLTSVPAPPGGVDPYSYIGTVCPGSGFYADGTACKPDTYDGKLIQALVGQDSTCTVNMGLAVAVSDDRKIYAAGYNTDPTGAINGTMANSIIARYNQWGQLDATWLTKNASNGIRREQFSTTLADRFRDIKIIGTKVVAVGTYADENTISSNHLMAVYNTSDGSLDTGFATVGWQQLDNPITGGAQKLDFYNAVASQSSAYLAVGGSEGKWFVGRFTTAGAWDTNFSTDGRDNNTPGAASAEWENAAFRVEVDGSNNAYVAGAGLNANATPDRDFGFVKYSSAGALDAAFDGPGVAGNGKFLIDVGLVRSGSTTGGTDYVRATYLDTTNNVLFAAGRCIGTRPCIVKLDATTGALKTDFGHQVTSSPYAGNGAIVFTSTNTQPGGTAYPLLSGTIYSIIQLSDGRLRLIGEGGSNTESSNTGGCIIIGLNANGSMDSTFATYDFGLTIASGTGYRNFNIGATGGKGTCRRAATNALWPGKVFVVGQTDTLNLLLMSFWLQ